MSAKLKGRIRGAFRSIVYPKGSTALRWKEIIILYLALVCVAMTITMLFPFLPAMVKHFGKTEEETGYYAGLIASAMFLGRFFASYFWGNLADKFGRRPVVIISLFLLSGSVFSFGWSSSVIMACVTRFCVGLVNGFLGTAKAIISEICDRTNQSLGMSAFTSAYSTGLMFGPAVGGFLSEVGKKYPQTFPKGSLFAKFPFLLPCLINAGLLLLSMVILYIWLPETLNRKKKSADSKKRGEDGEESVFVYSSLLKKSDKDLAAVDTNNKTKKSQDSENDQGAGSKTKENDSVVCTNDPHEQNSKNSREAKETPRKPHVEDDVSTKDDMSTISNTCESLLVANDGDGSCGSNDSRHSKYSEHDTRCTDNEASIRCSSCSTHDMQTRTCTRESECTDTIGDFPREDDVHEAHTDEHQTTGLQNKNESSRTESTSIADTCCNEDLTGKETSCHKKGKEEEPTITRKRTLNSSSCSTDSKKLKTPSIESVIKPACCPRECLRRCCSCSCRTRKKDSNLWSILRNCNAVLSILVYSLFSLSVIGSEELFNLWGATNTRLGGLAFSTDDLGTANLVVGVVTIVIQPTILPKIERKLGAILNFQVCVMVAVFIIVTQPFLRLLSSRHTSLWPALLVDLALLRMSVSGAFLSCFLLINNSVQRDLLCSINGLAVSVCSLFRATAPSIGGSLFAWSISSGYKIGFPFNMNLAFIVFGLAYLLAIWSSCLLTESLNEPKCLKNKDLSRDNLLEAKT